tara:strand:- start:50 stop:460 length:411 start_codon:yes stop_codon:yes gene_type:complete
MIDISSPDIYWLVLTVVLTALLWIPQILHSILRAGIKTAFLYPDEAATHYADWAVRSKAAHNNAVENLVIFAPLVLLVLLLNIGNELTALTTLIYFLTRIVHYVMHVLAIPLMRTVAFLIGFVCQLILGISILSIL